MFAVIKTGGKQYRVAADSVIEIATLDGEPGSTHTFGEVILFGDGEGAGLHGGAHHGHRGRGQVLEGQGAPGEGGARPGGRRGLSATDEI